MSKISCQLLTKFRLCYILRTGNKIFQNITKVLFASSNKPTKPSRTVHQAYREDDIFK